MSNWLPGRYWPAHAAEAIELWRDRALGVTEPARNCGPKQGNVGGDDREDTIIEHQEKLDVCSRIVMSAIRKVCGGTHVFEVAQLVEDLEPGRHLRGWRYCRAQEVATEVERVVKAENERIRRLREAG